VLAGIVVSMLFTAPAHAASGWQQLTNPPPFNPGVPFLLSDGRVLVQDNGAMASGTGNWWLLTPDAHGSYSDGTWTQAASLPSGYAPLYAADAVLPDGRFILVGGEYNNGDEAWTNQGAIYDPVANTWRNVAPPDGGTGNWSRIGDAPAVVLTDGSFLLGASGFSGTKDQAILDASNLTWTTTGAGKADGNGEEGFTLLPNGKVLTVDAKPDSCTTRNAEIYDPASGMWTSAGLTPAALIPCTGVNAGEIGPQLGMYDGRVFVEGATGATALYNPVFGTWAGGPAIPVIGGKQFVAADASSALLPDGKVLFDASPGVGVPPTHFFLFNGTSVTQIADDAGAAGEASNYGYMLLLPTGQVLFSYREGPTSLELYSDGGPPNAAWAPKITSVPSALAAGQTYTVSGTQLNGLSEGAAFGDDYQESTDYPLVQITHKATETVTYARTFGMTNRSIAPGAASSSKFALPACIPQGASDLRVIANGIASAPVAVSVGAATLCPKTLTVATSGSGRGRVTSTPAGIDCGSACSHPFPDGAALTLTESAAAGSTFTGWSGACSGAGACTINLTADSSATATFASEPRCVVPKVTGKRLTAAKSAIRNARCRVGKIRRAFSAKVKSGKVISQKPRPKTRLAAGSKVRLTVSKGKKR
jgi:hypothetical protein